MLILISAITCSNRLLSCSFPGPTTMLNGRPSDETATCLCVSYDRYTWTTRLLFRIDERAIDGNDIQVEPPVCISMFLSCGKNLLPYTHFRPHPMPSLSGLMRAITARHVAPSAACYQHVEYAINGLAVVCPLSAHYGLRRKMGLDKRPLIISQLTEFHCYPLSSVASVELFIVSRRLRYIFFDR